MSQFGRKPYRSSNFVFDHVANCQTTWTNGLYLLDGDRRDRNKKYKYARAPAKLVGRADSTRKATLVNGHCVLSHTQLMCSVLSVTNVFKLVKQFNNWLGVQRRQ